MTFDAASNPPSASDRPALSVIIPAHNEAGVIVQAVASVRRYALAHDVAVEIVIVDDGSRDGTGELARQSGSTPVEVRVLRNERNQGKGFTVRRGMLEARGELRLFCDADMSTPIEQLDELLPWVEEGFDVVIGSRKHVDSVLRPPQAAVRRMLGHVFRIVRSFVLLPEIRDTQCGFKLFTREAAVAIFSEQQITGPAFDCEVLALAQAMKFRMKEVGVLWRNNPDSRIHPLRDGWGMLMNLLKIRRRMKHFTPQVTRRDRATL